MLFCWQNADRLLAISEKRFLQAFSSSMFLSFAISRLMVLARSISFSGERLFILFDMNWQIKRCHHIIVVYEWLFILLK